MQYLIILMCALLSCTKVTTQGYVAKGNIKSKADSIYANCVVFAFVTLIFSFSVRGGISTDILLYAVLFGICSSGFQIFYALALEAGPFSATCMIINLSMAVNIIFACIYYGEALTVIKLIGLILCLFALFLNSRSDGKKVNVVMNEEKPETEEVVYEDGTGSFTFKADNGTTTLVWNDENEDAGKDMVFEYLGIVD